MQSQRDFRKFLILWSGAMVSSIGGGLSSFGLAYYVFTQTGSVHSMSLVSLFAFAPLLLLSVPAGYLSDRFNRRLMMMLGDVLSAFGLILILYHLQQETITLTIIYIGVLISSVFSSLIEPAFKATITDIVEPKDFTRASSMMSLASSARFLISPILAGFLLMRWNLQLLLLIDILTFIVTFLTTLVIHRQLGAGRQETVEQESFSFSFKELFEKRKGIFILALISAFITFYIGAVQILIEPMILSRWDSSALGLTKTLSASGMLVSSLYFGLRPIKSAHVDKMSLSFLLAGLFLAGFLYNKSLPVIIVFGFLFTSMMPVGNICLDYLVRTNITAKEQGKIWGVLGFVSQCGYVLAYGLIGLLTDLIARGLGMEVPDAVSAVLLVCGILLALTALILYFLRSVRELEFIGGNHERKDIAIES